MYVKIDESTYPCTRIVCKQNKVMYYGVLDAPENISGEIGLYRDDGFLLRTDNVEDYARHTYVSELLTLTNEPEPEYEPINTPPELTPAEQREQAYNTQPCVEWDEEMLTVTEAAQQWAYYAAEGNSEKTDALTVLIKAAKQSIREQYPDE